MDSARPIGVVPFQWAGRGAAPEDVRWYRWQLTCATAVNSIRWIALCLPQQPTSAQEVQPAAWSALGIDAVVVGQVTQNPDGSYQVAYQLGGHRRSAGHNAGARFF
ncbi:hypothetical protein LNP24_17185 [Klebsiella pneumoniae subsp. pneumoniae]|nr:hypothetical protein [Klebsiella pneumoniae subsp. pneumoniae]